ncbi:MAG: hypothetical protein AAFW87_08580 [Pseudomonadota bacterium]
MVHLLCWDRLAVPYCMGRQEWKGAICRVDRIRLSDDPGGAAALALAGDKNQCIDKHRQGLVKAWTAPQLDQSDRKTGPEKRRAQENAGGKADLIVLARVRRTLMRGTFRHQTHCIPFQSR